MSEDDAQVEVEESVVPEVPAVIAEALATIKAQAAAQAAAAAQAVVDEEARCAKLNNVKARVNAACGPVNDALLATTDPSERDALEKLMAETIAPFEAELEVAYREFSGQRDGAINPAPPGETFLESHVAVMGETESG